MPKIKVSATGSLSIARPPLKRHDGHLEHKVIVCGEYYVITGAADAQHNGRLGRVSDFDSPGAAYIAATKKILQS